MSANLSALSPRERTVTDFLLNRPGEAVTASAAELAALTGTSDATVVRTARSLGYSGLRELKRALSDMLTARRDPARVLDQRLEYIGRARVFDQVIADSADLVRRLPDVVDPRAFDQAVGIVEEAERTVVYGIGPASGAAHYLSLEVSRLGRRCTSLGATGFRLADDLLGLGPGDAVVVLSPLRLFREIDSLLRRAAEVGAPTVVITEALGGALAGEVDTVITTPPSTSGAAGENLAGWIVTHALAMELAARDRTGAVAAREHLNRLRGEIAGAEIDSDVLGKSE
ncbi:MurR/RpiR family transcriptional regulator [Nocardiopsis nanhaiensis]